MELNISKISLTGWNPRKAFDGEGLEELKQSIKEHGILEPLVVRPDGNGGYQLVAGERRYRAAKALGIEKVPVVIKELSDEQVREIMLLENLQREDLNPLEEAEAIRQILDTTNITQEQLARRLGKSQPWIANRLRLLETPQDLRSHIISREISPKHMMILLKYKQYGPLFRFLTRKTKQLVEKEGQISVKELEERIYHWIIYNADNEDLVFDLDPYDWQKPEWWEYFDTTECVTCEHRLEKDKGLHTVCLNRSCFKNKSNIAKQRYEKDLAEKKKKVEEEATGDENVVDTSKLEWNQWNRLKDRYFDISQCKGCEFLKYDRKYNPICLNTQCFDKKRRIHTRNLGLIRSREEEKVIEALYEYLNVAVDNELMISEKAAKALLEYLVEITYSLDDIKSMRRFGIKKWDDAEKIWEHIKGEHSLKVIALATLYARKMVGRYRTAGKEKLTFEDMKRVIPEAAEHYDRDLLLEAKGKKYTAIITITEDAYMFGYLDSKRVVDEEHPPEEGSIGEKSMLELLVLARAFFSREVPESHKDTQRKMLDLIHATIEIEKEREEAKAR